MDSNTVAREDVPVLGRVMVGSTECLLGPLTVRDYKECTQHVQDMRVQEYTRQANKNKLPAKEINEGILHMLDQDIDQGSVDALQVLLWLSIKKHHPKIGFLEVDLTIENLISATKVLFTVEKPKNPTEDEAGEEESPVASTTQ